MDSGEGKQTGDIVSAKKASAADEYYRYMLLKEKLKAVKDDDDPLLTVQSEREAIEINILRKLIGVTESSPEFAQIVDITGSRDRYEQARILSEVVYDKVRAETILSFYTPDKDKMRSYFVDATRQSADIRKGGLDVARNPSLNVSATGAAAAGATSLSALKRFASLNGNLG